MNKTAHGVYFSMGRHNKQQQQNITLESNKSDRNDRAT